MQGIQKVIYDIIAASRNLGLPYITTTEIKNEAMNTSLAELEKEYVNSKINQKLPTDKKKTKLDFAISQALYHLKKKKYIRQVKHGY